MHWIRRVVLGVVAFAAWRNRIRIANPSNGGSANDECGQHTSQQA